MQKNRNKIEEEIAARLTRIGDFGPMLKGTVSEVKRGARKRGTGERTAYQLTYKGEGNITKTVYVPAHRVKEVQDMLIRHREAVATLNGVVDLSVRLFKAKRSGPLPKDSGNA